MKSMKKIFAVFFAVALLGAFSVSIAFADDHRYYKKKIFEKARHWGYDNVIMLIPDGCDETVQTAARWYKEYSGDPELIGKELQVDKMPNADVKIHMANSVITGSAAAATAFASGHKTTVRFLGVGPRDTDLLTGIEPTAEPYAPVASVLEAAKMKGKATGIVSTSRVTHATPAAYGVHIEDRGWDNDIMEHLVYNNIDVVFGGGKRHLLPGSSCGDDAVLGGKRTDCENLLEVLEDRGYQFVETREDMLDLDEGPAWGLFNMSHMQPDMDRKHFALDENGEIVEPSLAEMTEKAIELLKQYKHGFFLMVEGSQVDWAGHNNDPIYMVKDFIAFDDAVKVACDFAKENGRTLVLAFPDHNTGGMKIGHYDTFVGYTATRVEDLVKPLAGMTMSANGVVAMMDGDYSEDNMIAAINMHWGIAATSDDIDEIKEMADEVGMSYALARVISKNHTVIGWTTHGHNGETVPVWVCGGDAPCGLIDNTDLALIAAEALGVNLDKVTKRLYVDISTVTDNYEIEVELVADCDDDGYCVYPGEIKSGGVLKVGQAELPLGKDYLKYKGRTYKLPGITVYASGKNEEDPTQSETVYVSRRAIKLLRWLRQL
jgi:alkaline phosphatase